jgi:hypothetical protein
VVSKWNIVRAFLPPWSSGGTGDLNQP